MLKIASYEIVAATENTHDSTLLQSTDLWRNIVEGKVFPNQVQKHLQALAYEKKGVQQSHASARHSEAIDV